MKQRLSHDRRRVKYEQLRQALYHCRKMETEIVSMTANMLNGDEETAGFLTSGGTESVLMAVKTYRDRAQKLFPTIKNPEIVGTFAE